MHLHHCSSKKTVISDDFIKEIPVLDIKSEIIFPTFFCEFKLDIDNQSILNECLELKNTRPKGVKKSNVEGWQSEVYSLLTITRDITPNIQNLAHNILMAANDISNQYNFDTFFDIGGCCWWININDGYSYNVMHSHPGCEIIALYYPKISSNSGNLNLVRCDGSNHIGLYENRPDFTNFELKAEEGTIYLFPSNILHYVKPNKMEDLRVSIAFNLSINK